MSTIQNIAILGATGSIGASTLDVIARHPSRFRVAALTANRQVDELAELCRRHRPDAVCVADASQAPRLRERIAAAGLACRVLAGDEGLVEIASLPGVDCVMAAIVGAAGLRATLAAAKAGKKLLLANKEALVVAGRCSWRPCARAAPCCCRSTASTTPSFNAFRRSRAATWRRRASAGSSSPARAGRSAPGRATSCSA